MGSNQWILDLAWPLFWLVLGLITVTTLWVAVRRLWRRRLAAIRRLHAEESVRCGQCGYDVRGLDIPRCPECGCAFGFDRTFDELGLSEEDVRQHVQKRRQELGEDGATSGD